MESLLGGKYIQSINCSDGELMFEFATNEDALKCKDYIERYRKNYEWAIYENILLLNHLPMHLVLNNYKIIDDVYYSKDSEILLKAPEYLEYFAKKQPIGEFMAKIDVWGEDLTRYNGFENAVLENVDKIQKGISLI